MSAPHVISMGATPRDETMPCGHCGKRPAGHDQNRISGKLYCYSFESLTLTNEQAQSEYVPMVQRIDGQPMVRGEDGLIHGDEISGDGSGAALPPLESHVGVCTLCGEMREIVGEVSVKESEARSSTRAVYCDECRNNGRLDDFTREDEDAPLDDVAAVTGALDWFRSAMQTAGLWTPSCQEAYDAGTMGAANLAAVRAPTLYRVTASILVRADSAALAKDRFSDLIDLDACPSEVEIDAVEHGTGARRPIEFTRSEALALFDLTRDFEGHMPGELDAAANKLGAMLGSPA